MPIQDRSVQFFVMPKNSLVRFALESLSGLTLLVVVLVVLNIFIGSSVLDWITRAGFTLGVLACLVEVLAVSPSRRRYTKIAISSESLILKRGRFIRTVNVIPMSRITVVRRSVGPACKMLGHADVIVVATTREIALPFLTLRDSAQVLRLINAYTHHGALRV